MNRWMVLCFFSPFFFDFAVGDVVEIYSLNLMDDDRGFCIDIRGYKSKAKVNRGLQAHTCYSSHGAIAVDQGFDPTRFSAGQFYLPAFDVCIETESAKASASLNLQKCQPVKRQELSWDEEGRIRLVGDRKLCITIANGVSRRGGGGFPVNRIRNLSLEYCRDALKPFQLWGVRKIGG